MKKCVLVEPSLFYNGKKIAKLEEKSVIVDKAFKPAESVGIKKLRLRTTESVAGLREKRIFEVLNYLKETLLQSS